MEQSDRELIQRYLDGYTGALEELVHKYRRPLFGFICNMTRGNDEPEEIFQEVWFRAIKKLDLYKSKNFCGWLIRIAHNLVIDRARRRKPELSLDWDNNDGRSLVENIAHRDEGPVSKIEAGELGRRIEKETLLLPSEQKEVFIMRAQLSMSFKEIAKIQGVSINTALARMQYALDKLRQVLRSDYDELCG